MTKKKSKVQSNGKVLKVAPGQALGYGLQYTRLTSMLLDAPKGSFCSLEVLDDVATQSTSGEVQVCQIKSSLTGNPVSDRSVQLWKSLYNWVSAVQSGLIDPGKTKFQLYVSKPVKGQIIDVLTAAKSDLDGKKAIALAKEVLWGSAPEYLLKSKLSPELAQYANFVLESDEEVLTSIVTRLKLECGSGSPLSDLQEKMKGKFVSASKVDEVVNQACGWVKTKVDKLLEEKQPAVISTDEFLAEITSFVRKVDRDLILNSYAPEPTEKEKHAELPRRYVQQLDLIELSFDDKLQAISDFLRACYDRTVWAQKGEVNRSSFDDLDKVLKRSWGNIARRVRAEHKSVSEVDQGQVVYSDCMEQKSPLQSMETPDHFISGCYQRLADELDVGWHPRYRDFLADAVKKKSA
ncbi:MAG: hypothetical protein E8D44_10320 [Nitrospira sp.]|nr:MAG: hypothetical protein E8D44_10320 [Nitrospira sp.]